MKTIVISVGVVMLLIVGVIGYQLNRPSQPVEQNQGGVPVASEYHNLTTKATTSDAYLIKSGQGVFGSVVVSTLGTGYAIFYDASSTNPNLRTTQATSSLRIVGLIDASQAAGTYVFDDYFVDGLMVDYIGTQGTSTVLFR